MEKRASPYAPLEVNVEGSRDDEGGGRVGVDGGGDEGDVESETVVARREALKKHNKLRGTTRAQTGFPK